LEGPASKRVAAWCIDYFEKYSKAPKQDIWSIYYSKAEDLPKGMADDIEQDYLPGLAELEEDEPINLQYLLDQTHGYFKKRNLELFTEEIQGHLLDENVSEAERIATGYKGIAREIGNEVNLKDEAALEKIDKAFNQSNDILIEYPRVLGKFWNRQLRREALVALLSQEKRGKSYWLMDMAVRASKQKRKVAFFQAGDMTEEEQIMRICIHMTGRSNLKEYSGKHYQVIRDCIKNQMNTCDKPERQCSFGVFEDWSEKEVKSITKDEIIKAMDDFKDYETCRNCSDYWKKRGYGSIWLTEVNSGKPLTLKEAREQFKTTFTNKRSLMLSSHSNNTLSVNGIRTQLDIWER
jgi:hypothetical protein